MRQLSMSPCAHGSRGAGRWDRTAAYMPAMQRRRAGLHGFCAPPPDQARDAPGLSQQCSDITLLPLSPPRPAAAAAPPQSPRFAAAAWRAAGGPPPRCRRRRHCCCCSAGRRLGTAAAAPQSCRPASEKGGQRRGSDTQHAFASSGTGGGEACRLVLQQDPPSRGALAAWLAQHYSSPDAQPHSALR